MSPWVQIKVSLQIAAVSADWSPCGLNTGKGLAKMARVSVATAASAALRAMKSGSETANAATLGL